MRLTTMVEAWIECTLAAMMIALNLAVGKLYHEGKPLEAFHFAVLVVLAGSCLFTISVIYRVLEL